MDACERWISDLFSIGVANDFLGRDVRFCLRNVKLWCHNFHPDATFGGVHIVVDKRELEKQEYFKHIFEEQDAHERRQSENGLTWAEQMKQDKVDIERMNDKENPNRVGDGDLIKKINQRL